MVTLSEKCLPWGQAAHRNCAWCCKKYTQKYLYRRLYVIREEKREKVEAIRGVGNWVVSLWPGTSIVPRDLTLLYSYWRTWVTESLSRFQKREVVGVGLT